MIDVFVGVLAALIAHSLIRAGARAVDWRLSVNRGYSFRVPLHVQFVRAIAGRER